MSASNADETDGEKLSEAFEHGGDAALFLFVVGMDVEVERGADVGMAEEDADRLIITAGLNAASSETMAQSMKLDERYMKRGEKLAVIVAIGAWLGGFGAVG